MKKIQKFYILFWVTLLFLSLNEVKALSPLPTNISPEKAENNGLTNCFQYYDFGSIEMNLDSEKGTYYSGEEIFFEGKIKNKNQYPIVDGQIYAKIFRKDSEEGAQSNGDFQIDESFLMENINLPAEGEKDVNLKYILPYNVISGEYVAHFFFTVSKKYNLAGLSFHSSMPGSTAIFEVSGNEQNGIFFDKDKVNVNGAEFNSRQTNDSFDGEKPLDISVPLLNKSDKNEEVEILKEIFFWDGLNDENRIGVPTKEKISVSANSEKIITHTINKPEKSVYFLRISAVSNKGKSVINIRPTFKNIFEPRLNYPAVISFPLHKGVNSVISTCFHNAGEDRDNGKVLLTLKDEKGNTIIKHEYSGLISGDMLGMARNFAPAENYKKVILEAEIYDKEGNVRDRSVQEYDCNAFDPSICENRPAQVFNPAKIELPGEKYSSDISFEAMQRENLYRKLKMGLIYFASTVIFIFALLKIRNKLFKK